MAHKFGLTDREFSILQDIVILPLQKAGAKVWVFGSRARLDHKQNSDIDLLYEFKGGKAPSGVLFDIKTNLDESRFPYILDLVSADEVADSYRDDIFNERLLL
jgi:predicted nucleotidyltransferase